jgi:hypothetical protein
MDGLNDQGTFGAWIRVESLPQIVIGASGMKAALDLPIAHPQLARSTSSRLIQRCTKVALAGAVPEC